MTDNSPDSYSPLGLAYLGDAVFELLVREMILLDGNAPTDKYMGRARGFVSASAQSKSYAVIEPLLTEAESAVLKRGRNAKGHSTTKNTKKHKENHSITDYRRATGLEALFGYLYLNGQKDRIYELFKVILETKE